MDAGRIRSSEAATRASVALALGSGTRAGADAQSEAAGLLERGLIRAAFNLPLDIVPEQVSLHTATPTLPQPETVQLSRAAIAASRENNAATSSTAPFVAPLREAADPLGNLPSTARSPESPAPAPTSPPATADSSPGARQPPSSEIPTRMDLGVAAGLVLPRALHAPTADPAAAAATRAAWPPAELLARAAAQEQPATPRYFNWAIVCTATAGALLMLVL